MPAVITDRLGNVDNPLLQTPLGDLRDPDDVLRLVGGRIPKVGDHRLIVTAYRHGNARSRLA